MNNKPTTRETCPICWGYSIKIEVGKFGICPGCGYKWKSQIPFSTDWEFNLKMQPYADEIYHQLWHPTEIQRDLDALDKERGIDVILICGSGLSLALQEKYRRFKFLSYNQFTVEYENNPSTKEKGEFFKLAANYYFYGYANRNESEFCQWYIVDLNQFKSAYENGEIIADEIGNNYGRSNASFLCFDFGKINDVISYRLPEQS